MPEIGEKKAKLELLSEQELKLYKLRHSIAHVAATAVIRLFPGVKLGFGPPVENGFYYDFEFPKEITVEDLPRIEKEMRKIIGQKVDFVREDMTVENAREMMVKDNQTFKVDLIDELTAKG
jgi:threonyl-tRNA synthetase